MEPRELRTAAKRLRDNPTTYEILFRRKLISWGIKFKFQKTLCGYVADFFLPQYGLVIEIDGSGHYTEWGIAKDKLRDAKLVHEGYTVLHIRNPEVWDYRKEDLIEYAERSNRLPEDRTFHNTYLSTLS